MRAAPIATSVNLRYVIHFPSLQNGLINCFYVSLCLIVFEQYFVYHSICPNCLRFLRSKVEFFVLSTLVAAMFRKSGMLDRSKWRMTLFIRRNLPQEITVMIINTGQMCTVNYSGRNMRFKVPWLYEKKCVGDLVYYKNKNSENIWRIKRQLFFVSHSN